MNLIIEFHHIHSFDSRLRPLSSSFHLYVISSSFSFEVVPRPIYSIFSFSSYPCRPLTIDSHEYSNISFFRHICFPFWHGRYHKIMPYFLQPQTNHEDNRFSSALIDVAWFCRFLSVKNARFSHGILSSARGSFLIECRCYFHCHTLNLWLFVQPMLTKCSRN